MQSCSSVSTLQKCDYLPFVSSYTNCVALFHQYVGTHNVDGMDSEKSHVYTYYQNKSPIRCAILLIPIIGNLLVAAYDMFLSIFPSRNSNVEQEKTNPNVEEERTLPDSPTSISEHERASSTVEERDLFSADDLGVNILDRDSNGKVTLKKASIDSQAPCNRKPSKNKGKKTTPPAPSHQDEAVKKMLKYLNKPKVSYQETKKRIKEGKFGDNREVMMKVVGKYPYLLKEASKELKNDKDLVCKALKKNGNAVQHASASLKEDNEVATLAILSEPLSLNWFSDKIKGNRFRVKDAIRKDPRALRYATPELQTDKKLVLEHKSKKSFENLVEMQSPLLQDPKFVVDFINTGDFTVTLPESLRNDKNFWEAFTEVLSKMVVVPPTFQNYLKQLGEDIKKDPSFFTKLVKVNGWYLFYAPKEIRKNSEVVKVAVGSNPQAFKFVDKELLDNKEILKELVLHAANATKEKMDENPQGSYKNMLKAYLPNSVDFGLRREVDKILSQKKGS